MKADPDLPKTTGIRRYMLGFACIFFLLTILPVSVLALPPADAFDTPPANDDTPQAATPIGIGMIQRCDIGLDGCSTYFPQEHNFHRERDEDWVKFYAVQNAEYEINFFGEVGAETLGVDGFQIDDNGVTRSLQITEDEVFAGETEPVLRFLLMAAADGFVFLRVFPQQAPADNNTYVISVDRSRDFAGFITGSLTDADSQEALIGGWVKSFFEEDDQSGTTATRSAVSLQPDGKYLIVHPAGVNITITAGAPGYEQSAPRRGATLAELSAAEINFSLERLPQGRGNFPPDRPLPISPLDQEMLSESPLVLTVDAFSDPDQGDTHVQSQWQLALDDAFATPVVDGLSATHLVQLPLAGPYVLPASTYYWRVRFIDSSGFTSPWSQPVAFITADNTLTDTNANGVPDTLEPTESTDLDGDEVPDENQPDLLRLTSAAGEALFGIALNAGNGQLVRATTVDPADLEMDTSPPDPLPWGLLAMRIETDAPGDTVSVSLYVDQSIPATAAVLKYDPTSGYHPYDTHSEVSADEGVIRITLSDGGKGDGDGLINGVIVDPVGVSFEDTPPPPTPLSEGGGGGGGCFLDLVNQR
ncbi:MAG: hypothetical protein QNJ22_05395 [Desulfosarcinaceae bacterium]|nr:hypothetical protein [Desulfosarcinaceae bacterium]